MNKKTKKVNVTSKKYTKKQTILSRMAPLQRVTNSE